MINAFRKVFSSASFNLASHRHFTLSLNGFVLSVLVLLFASPQAFAVGVDLEGYFRTRATFAYNQDLDRDLSPSLRNYADFRFRLDPTFFITDKIRIKSSLNFVDGLLGDAPFRGVPYDNPAQVNSTVIGNTVSDASAAGYRVGRGMTDDEMDSWVYGGAYAPDAMAQTAGLQPLQVRRAWMEVEFPIGVLKAGRMPFELGMGIYGNAGDRPDQEIGSTRDRILFETGIGNYYLVPGVSWFYEGLVDQSSDDAYEYFFHLGRKVPDQHVSLYLAYNGQDAAKNPATNGSLVGEGTNYWVVDFYVQNKFSIVDVRAEAFLAAGDFIGKELFAVNAAVRSEWYLKPKLDLLLEFGYSSGTSDSEAANDEIKTFAFNRDYNISYILFEEALPGGINRGGRSAHSPHSGAVANTLYPRFKVGYEVASFFRPALNVIAPIAAKKSLGAAGRLYGIEYNLITMWPINDYVEAEFTFAHFLPGGFFDSVSQTHQTTLLRAGVNVIF